MAKVDIIIPVYHPGHGWIQHLMDQFTEGLNKIHQYTLIIVNDGGPSLPPEEQQDLKQLQSLSYFDEVIVYEYPQNLGKGHAVRMGIAQGKCEIVIYTDDDLPYGIDVINLMVKELLNDSEIVLPRRGADYFRSLSIKRRIISKGLIIMNRLLMKMKYADTQAGLKGLQRGVSDLIQEGRENGFLFEVEWISKAEKKGSSIVTIPVTIKDKVVPSGVPGGDIRKLFGAYLRLFRSR